MVTDEDQHPECPHEWGYIGLSTIGDPPVRSEACVRCRQFRNTSLFHVFKGTAWDTGPESVTDRIRYANEWFGGPWGEEKWAEFAAQSRS